MPTVILSDNKPFEIPQLGIFELDELRRKPLGVFTYQIEVMGRKYDVEFDMSTWPQIPQKPENPNPKPETAEWYDLQNYNLYQAGLLHEERRLQQMSEYAEDIAWYILKKCGDDVNRITTQEDWQKVYNAALVPQLTIEILADTLQKTYQAEFDGLNVLEALQNIGRDAGGKYNTLRQWENELMVRLNMTELEYSLLPLAERARKVCSLFLPDVMAALEYERDKKKRDEKRKTGKK